MYRSARFLAIAAGGLALAACDFDRADEVVQARIGQNLSTVISSWGFPTDQKEVAGRDLVYWTQTELSYDDVPQISIEAPIGSSGSISAQIPLAEPTEMTCSRVLEIDSNQVVINAALEGNDCPYYAPSGW